MQKQRATQQPTTWRKKQPSRLRAVFLDRDGTMNALVPGQYILHAKDLRILPGVARAVRALNRLGYLVIVITNQGTIARGRVTAKHVENLHGLMVRRLARGGAKISAIYYCPHHPEGIMKEHAFVCRCRKPAPGMLTKAIRELHIDPRQSFMVGDTTGDMLAGKRAKLTTILVGTGYGGRDGKHRVKSNHHVRNLAEAVTIIARAT